VRNAGFTLRQEQSSLSIHAGGRLKVGEVGSAAVSGRSPALTSSGFRWHTARLGLAHPILKAVLKTPHSRRLRDGGETCGCARRLECGAFTAALVGGSMTDGTLC
jgi:hypothetical protein